MEIDHQQNHAAENPNDVSPSTLPAAQPEMSRALKRVLIIANCLMLCLGNAGGPILLRVYFIHGGKRKWFSAWLETGGWPLLALPLLASFRHRRRGDRAAPLVLMTPRLALACAFLGLLTGADDYLYSYGLSFLPVSTSAVLIASQLAFTAVFAYLIVRQRFTAFSINAVALLTVGAASLAMHASGDKPEGVSTGDYWKGFMLTLGAAALYGLVLPLVELTYAKAGRAVTYTLVMEMQLLIGLSATMLCTVGMIINKDFQAIKGEAKNFGLGETKYYLLIFSSAIVWQCFFLGAVGVISCVNTLLAGILIAVFIPVIELLSVLFLHERFGPEKGLAMVLCLWGLASYSYGEHREAQLKHNIKKDQSLLDSPSA